MKLVMQCVVRVRDCDCDDAGGEGYDSSNDGRIAFLFRPPSPAHNPLRLLFHSSVQYHGR